MSENLGKDPLVLAQELFDSCPNRVIIEDRSRSGSVTLNLKCAKHPGPRQLSINEREYAQAIRRGQEARKLGCIGCKYSTQEKSEVDAAVFVDRLHPTIKEGCGELYAAQHYTEAALKGHRIVRDRLRGLTGHERGSEAFGKGGLYIDVDVEEHVNPDFQKGVQFLSMAIDCFRNVGSHTANPNISGQDQAYDHLAMSSLMMFYLDSGQVANSAE